MEFEATELLGQLWSQELVSASLLEIYIRRNTYPHGEQTQCWDVRQPCETMLEAEGNGFD